MLGAHHGIARHPRLDALSQQIGDPRLARKVADAANAVRKALKPGDWSGPNQIKKAGGAAIFAQEHVALTKIAQLLKADLPVGVKVDLNQIALNLTDADRILAETANTAAGGGAQAFVNAGDQQRAAGDYAKSPFAFFVDIATINSERAPLPLPFPLPSPRSFLTGRGRRCV